MPGAETTSRFFDSYAHDFDAIYGGKHSGLNALVNKHFRKSMRLRYEKTLAGCDPIEGRSVLDVGCGPGHFGIALARRGASRVFGIDFAPGMIDLARSYAEKAGVADRCRFELGDFMSSPLEGSFDYTILMGFMDYMADPRAVIERALSLTRSRAFFSFPVAGGLLGWQRQLRYKRRCDLYLYTLDRVRSLFEGLPGATFTIEPIARDFFVTLTAPGADLPQEAEAGARSTRQ
ncbi:MAG TPA: methyltransferase domain-containing protein [Isosphaeraceae bacterium]|jgi:2-polyprenyl-3-methyl-5-hydroxy-6-metoxy-1,4-benzoquinol methylase|nr:methyltransferase domain-containing protein [Isosphaeraceae bacterium]